MLAFPLPSQNKDSDAKEQFQALGGAWQWLAKHYEGQDNDEDEGDEEEEEEGWMQDPEENQTETEAESETSQSIDDISKCSTILLEEVCRGDYYPKKPPYSFPHMG